MVRKVIELPLVYKSYHWYSPDQKRHVRARARQLVQVLAARDDDRAELIMRGHVYDGRDVLLANLHTIAARLTAPTDGSDAVSRSAAGGLRAGATATASGPGRSPACAWSSSGCSSPARSPGGCSATWAPT